jgi:hypothetical protein
MLFRIVRLWAPIPTAFVPGLGETWLDFRYRAHAFSINNQFGDWWFFVKDRNCPEALLENVAQHFVQHSEPRRENR